MDWGRRLPWLLALCLLASTAHAEDERRSRRDDGASSAEEGESRESARERRRRRREERAREKAAREAEAQAPVAARLDEPPPPPSAPQPEAPVPAPAEVDDIAEPRKLYASEELLRGEGPLDAAMLPAPYGLPLTKSAPETLRKLDGRLSETVDALQAGERCQTLRSASRVPLRTWLWREHQRELSVAAGLFVLAFLLAFAVPSPALRALLPIVPLLGCVYVAWDGANRAGAVMDTITRGLRACSTALEEGDPSASAVVRGHLEQVARMGASIDAAYEQRDGLVPRFMQEYKL